jgi:putative hydrolases of HD superfamily
MEFFHLSRMEPIPSSGPLAFLLELDRMKEIWRKNPVHGTTRMENDAEHSWHAALAALALSPWMPQGTDAHRVSRLLLVHDLGEIDTGDVLAYGKDEAKAAREERSCLERVLGILPSEGRDELRTLWLEFEEGCTPEARAAWAIDRMLPCLENLASDGRAWKEHGVRLEQSLARNGVIGEIFPGLWDEIRPRIEAVFVEIERGRGSMPR